MIFAAHSELHWGGLAYLLLCGEVVPKLPHQVLFFRGQLFGRRVADNYLLVMSNDQVSVTR